MFDHNVLIQILCAAPSSVRISTILIVDVSQSARPPCSHHRWTQPQNSRRSRIALFRKTSCTRLVLASTKIARHLAPVDNPTVVRLVPVGPIPP
ncbi:hypothetical protein B9Z55_020276 [Caenorhabditis nigoni]|uniref:Uncharacterized protein n=1 Tax=Caenorhabditis nigoni TaxID=1611254 RepID=A0A2G5TM01_9PELO|nr:hypothetical protein B9Z55_020276 [Caenorhabditis nigoni]